jgi:2-polyprenyl-3-methyl-5-hydroxy-6-metoxy-1,4-benzoquinol methylase
MNFDNRSEELELMDDPDMDAEKYREAYIDINKCNQLLGGYGITINSVLKLIRATPKESYTIIDMGCGDGEMLRKLSKALRKEGIAVALIGIDLRDDVLEIARSKSKGYSDIEFKKQDILTLDKGIGCDILLCTLTMHHFTDEQIKIFTKKFYELASIGVVINDLERNILSYQLFKLFSFFFIKTSIAKTDGLISISKGFRKQELIDFAKNIPNVIHVIKWKWAFRYVWVMQTNRPS